MTSALSLWISSRHFASAAVAQTRIDAFDYFSRKDDLKVQSIFDREGTLTKFHYLFIPIWWSDESPREPIDQAELKAAYYEVTANYDEMYFGKVRVTL